MRINSSLAQHLTGLRLLLVLTVVTGLAYPLAVLAVAQLPGLRAHAHGSLLHDGGRVVGSSLIGQAFTDAKGDALPQYFQSRPSAAGNGYDPTATSASNLGPESVVDTLGDPARADDAQGDGSKPSLLTQVCTRSLAVGALDGVSGARPYCTATGVGAVLAVFRSGGNVGPVVRVVSLDQECPAVPFLATYAGVRVTCASYGADYSHGIVTPIRGDAPETSAVPPDAVTSSASGLDFEISPAYAHLQTARVARARGLSAATVAALVRTHTAGRALGFLGEPGVNVVALNLALDRLGPAGGAH